MRGTFVVVGGGIAGITCVEHLGYLAPNEKVILVTSSPLIKNVTNIVPLSKSVYRFDVNETEAKTLKEKFPSLEVVYDAMVELKSSENRIITEKGSIIQYDYLCLCNGANPKVIPRVGESDRILTIRDTGSVKNYLNKIQNSKKLLVVGNGGIASELVYSTKGVDTTWVIKDKYISSTFVDPGAAEFFRSSENFAQKNDPKTGVVKRMKFSEEIGGESTASDRRAAALGPDWLKGMQILGINENSSLRIVYEAEIDSILSEKDSVYPLSVRLTNGDIIECDLVVSAVGVNPNLDFKSDIEFVLGPDGGLCVDWKMTTSKSNVYAAGDVCHANWHSSPNWFQMRLWTQAHQMGGMVAKSMAANFAHEEIMQDFCFELFAHTTTLFGYQVVLLGKFNGQGFGNDYEILIRSTPNVEYIKFVLVDDRLQGAILIGDTGLEETCENLILNQIDLSPYGDDILNPDIDIEDYFD